MICFKQLFQMFEETFFPLRSKLTCIWYWHISKYCCFPVQCDVHIYTCIMYYRIQNEAAPDDPVFALVILAALTAPLHGNLIPVPPFSLLQNNVHFQEKKLKWLTNLLHKITSCIYTQIVHVQFFWLVFSLLWSFISINF